MRRGSRVNGRNEQASENITWMSPAHAGGLSHAFRPTSFSHQYFGTSRATPRFVRARAGWKMENRCNCDAGKFKPAELLPTKLILGAMLNKSCQGRESLPNSDQTATISPRKLIGDLFSPTEKFPICSGASRPRLATSLSVFSTQQLEESTFRSCVERPICATNNEQQCRVES